MGTTIVLTTIIALLVGFALGAIIVNVIRKQKIAMMNESIEQCKLDSTKLNETIENLRQEIEDKKNLLTDELVREASLKEQVTNLQSNMTAKEEEWKQEEQERNDKLTTQFRLLANDILKQHADRFDEGSKEKLTNLLDPFKKEIESFRTRVDQINTENATRGGELKQQLDALASAYKQISQDANNLTHALKGESKTQGNWGEMILDSLLRNSGLTEGREYTIQTTLTDNDDKTLISDSGHRMQPDVILNYPGGGKLIIDSKVSLTDYEKYMSADNEEQKSNYLKEHIKSVIKHVTELSGKDYSSYVKDSPNFVMMFIPIEPAYSLAIQADPNLWNKAYEKKVVLMSPTNLIAVLRFAYDLWSRELRIENAEDIAKRATLMYEKFVGFVDSMHDIGTALDKAHNVYGNALNQLSEGRGSLMSQAKKLEKMGITPKKKLSDNVPADSDEDQE